MTKLLTGLLNKESGAASVSFALLAASASIVAMAAIKLVGAKIGWFDGSLEAVLRHIQVYRLVWDASSVQFGARLQQNERYYVSDPMSSLSQDSFVATMLSWLTDAKRILTG
jgi:Flp pilus assembly pilin Flp